MILDEVTFDVVYPDLGVKHGVRVEKHLQGKHDQSSHGSWADNQIIVNDSGSGLTFREMVHLQLSSDRYQSKVYKAEKVFNINDDDKNKPVAPKRNDFATYQEYKTAWMQYEKNWNNWQSSVQDVQFSDLGKKHIDGTVKGIQSYYNAIKKSDWFVAEFGNGAGTPELKIAVRKVGSYAGRHRFGIKISGAKGYQEINDIFINKNYAKNEPTLIHELAHYATMLKEDSKHEGHGVEFVRNSLFIWEHLAGEEVADILREEYIAEGIPL